MYVLRKQVMFGDTMHFLLRAVAVVENNTKVGLAPSMARAQAYDGVPGGGSHGGGLGAERSEGEAP